MAGDFNQVGVQFTGNGAGAINAAKSTAAAIGQVRREAGAASPGLHALQGDIGKVERGALAGSGALRGLGRSVAYASGTFIGVAGFAQAVRSSIDAAENLGKANRQLDVQIRAVGDSTQAAAPVIADVDRRMLALGHSSAETNTAFAQLVRATGSVAEAEKLIGLTADLAAARHISLERAAVLVGKVADGNVSVLNRYGIAIAKGTSVTDALAQAQAKLAGQAQAAVTPQEKLHAAVQNLEAGIGEALLPSINHVADAIDAWISKSGNQKKVTDDVRTAVDLATGAFRTAKTVIDEVDQVTGSLKHTLEILLAFKVASVLNGWAGGFTKLIGTEAAAGAGAEGLAGASALAGLLRLRLLALTRLAPIAIPITLQMVAPHFSEEIRKALAYLPNQVYKAFDSVFGTNIFGSVGYKSPRGPVPGQGANAPGYVPPAPGQSFNIPRGSGVQLPSAIVPTHQTAGLAGFPAVDIMARPGTPIRAPEDGVITRISGHEPSAPPPEGQGGPWGLSIYFLGTRSGNTYYMTHLVKVAEPGSYARGAVIGVIGDYPGSSADHVHFAIHKGDSSEAHAPSGLFAPSDFLGVAKPGSLPTTTPKPAPSASPLPAPVRLAISLADTAAAKAATTPSKADDKAAIAGQRKALEDEIAWLKQKLQTNLSTEKRITLQDLLTGAYHDLASLGTTKKAGGATIGAVTSLRDTIKKALAEASPSKLALQGLGPELDTVEQTAVTKLKQLRDKLKVGMSASDLAQTRSQIKRWGGVLKDEISKQGQLAKQAAQAAAKVWQQGWQQDVNQILRQFDERAQRQLGDFDRETQRGLQAIADKYAAPTPQEQQLADFQAQRAQAAEDKQKSQIQSQISDVQNQLAQLNVDSGGQLTAQEVQQKQADLLQQLADLQDQYQQLLLDDQERGLQDAADQSRRAADDQAKREAQDYQDQRDRQRQALQDQLDDERTYLQASLDAWEVMIEGKKTTWAAFIAWLAANGYSTAGLTQPGGSSDGTLAGPASVDTTLIPDTGFGRPHTISGGFAAGGKIPGSFVGREDTVMARVTPGETVIDRQLTQALERMVASGGGGGTTIHATVLGATERQVGAALERLTTPAAGRVVTDKAPRL